MGVQPASSYEKFCNTQYRKIDTVHLLMRFWKKYVPETSVVGFLGRHIEANLRNNSIALKACSPCASSDTWIERTLSSPPNFCRDMLPSHPHVRLPDAG